MADITMKAKDYLFLRQYMPSLPRYIRHMVYQRDEVVMEIADDSFQDFLLDYRSAYVRFGTTGEMVNDTGARLNRIFRDHIQPLIRSH